MTGRGGWWRRLADRTWRRPRLHAHPRGLVLTGTVWPGGDRLPAPGRVVLDAEGRIALIALDGRAGDGPPAAPDPSGFDGLPVVAAAWIGPALVDAHVHLGGAVTAARLHAAGLAAVRHVGPAVATTAPDTVVPPLPTGPDPAGVQERVRALLRDGARAATVDLTAGPDAVGAAVEAAHTSGLAVLAVAPTAALVVRALDARVDELLRVPVERLDEALVERIAAAGLGVTSTLQAWFSAGEGRGAALNAAALVRAGVALRYGTDAGAEPVPGDGEPGAATVRAGIDARELDRLADTGLGRLGALRAATDRAALAPGIVGHTGRLSVGDRADLVALPADPLVEPLAWHAPVAVIGRGRPLTGLPDWRG